MISSRRKIGLLLTFVLTGGYTFAQQADTLSESAYQYTPSKQGISLYTGILPVIVFGVLVLLMAYVGYRYWHDHVPDDDTKHTPHHQ